MLLSVGPTKDDDNDDLDSLLMLMLLEMVQMWFRCPHRNTSSSSSSCCNSNNNNQTSHSIGRSSQRRPHAADDGDVVALGVLISGCPLLFLSIRVFLQPLFFFCTQLCLSFQKGSNLL
mmetsp:Transcript_61898/g.151304  ORF Transcript_61898/g.151304 Transcript_61898/m.151304 type:complete len:118 (-) Transcript_61898:202-555(-)